MNRVELVRTDVAYLYFAFANLPSGATAQAQIGASGWGDIDFSGPKPRMLVRGPDAAGGNGLLVPASGAVRVRFTSAPEFRTVPSGYVTLVQSSG